MCWNAVQMLLGLELSVQHFVQFGWHMVGVVVANGKDWLSLEGFDT